MLEKITRFDQKVKILCVLLSHESLSTKMHYTSIYIGVFYIGYFTGYSTEFSLCFTPCISMTKWNIQLKCGSKDRYLKALSKEYNIVTPIFELS